MNRNIISIATYIFLVPLVYYIPSELDKALKISKLSNVLISVGFIVIIMSYFIMPFFKKAYTLILKK